MTRWTARLALGALVATSGFGALGCEDGSGTVTFPPGVGDIVVGSDTSADGDAGGDGDGDGGAVVDPGPPVDLRVDHNRSGAIEWDDPTEDEGEDVWDATGGAVFLANIDDDDRSCPTTGTDYELAACFDAADEAVDGPDDLLDMAPMELKPWEDAPDDAVVSFTVPMPGAQYIRVFRSAFQGGEPAWVPTYLTTQTFGAAELREGMVFVVEGRDIVRDSDVWDGSVTIGVQVTDGAGEVLGEDTVALRVSPVMTFHHMLQGETVYATEFSSQDSQAFIGDLRTAVDSAGLPNPLFSLFLNDQWTQDYFEPGYMAMPGPDGTQHAIRINYRSANVYNAGSNSNPLRPAGKVVFETLRGPDMAGIQEFDLEHPGYMDTLDSFGNTETIPPFTHEGVDYPLGRMLRGSVDTYYPDEKLAKLFDSQGQQPLVAVDTSWLVVGHVDETLTFIETDAYERGWTMAANDPAMAVTMLQDLDSQGYGDVVMFEGKDWGFGTGAADVTVAEVLADEDVMSETQKTIAEVDAQVAIVKAATGLTDDEIVPIPYTHTAEGGYSVAYQPGTVNGVKLNRNGFAPPKPHGPVIDGKDVFETQFEEAMAEHGIQTYWVENWDLYHRLLGEVHCGSNTHRAIPDVKWWETGR